MSDFERILYEAEHQDAYYLSVIKDRAFSVLSMILRQARIVEKPVRRICENTACGIAARYIEDNKNLFLTCRDVAAYCHFNEKYLSRLFKKELGVTLLEYIHAVKTNEAKRLLSETEAPLSEVAEMLGFSNEYYFNSFFKRNIGISPGSYRAKGK
jgi:AraC-like DNA-binding protein